MPVGSQKDAPVECIQRAQYWVHQVHNRHLIGNDDTSTASLFFAPATDTEKYSGLYSYPIMVVKGGNTTRKKAICSEKKMFSVVKQFLSYLEEMVCGQGREPVPVWHSD